MKIIKITESQYKRLVRVKNLNEQIIYPSMDIETQERHDITPDLKSYLGWLNDTLGHLHNLPLYINKIESGVVYIDWGKYSEEEKDLIKKYNKEWVDHTIDTKDSVSGTGYYSSGLDWDFEDEPKYVYNPEDWPDETKDGVVNEPIGGGTKIEKEEDDEIDIVTINGNSGFIVGKQVSIDKNGPENHGSRIDRKRKDWQSGNATDIFANPGTTVYSITKGNVISIGGNENKHTGSIFGLQITVKGEDGYPDVFYTHLQKAKVKKGDKITIGTPLAEITPWYNKIGGAKSSHVHVGLPWGEKLSSLIDLNTGKIKN